MTTAPSQSAEDYLERILELIQETGQARVVDIANSLNIRQASVTNMVKKLCELGFVDHEKYKRGLVLTETGREVAQRIQRRHETLSRFFSLLELDDNIQRKDIWFDIACRFTAARGGAIPRNPSYKAGGSARL